MKTETENHSKINSGDLYRFSVSYYVEPTTIEGKLAKDLRTPFATGENTYFVIVSNALAGPYEQRLVCYHIMSQNFFTLRKRTILGGGVVKLS